MTPEQITLLIVHIGGLIIDLSVGFLMFFDKTRLLGTLISCSFHLMNSRMFNIGWCVKNNNYLFIPEYFRL